MKQNFADMQENDRVPWGPRTMGGAASLYFRRQWGTFFSPKRNFEVFGAEVAQVEQCYLEQMPSRFSWRNPEWSCIHLFFFPLTLCVSVSERKEVKGYLHGVLYPQQVLRASLDLCQAFWTRPQKTEICCICSHEIDSPLFGLSPLCLLRIIPTSECVFLSQQADLFQLFLLLLFNDIQREQLTSRVTATFKKDLLLKVCLLPGDKTQSVFFYYRPWKCRWASSSIKLKLLSARSRTTHETSIVL